MKDSHLTLRIPGELAEEIDRRAAERGVPRSMVVREAVAQYLAAPVVEGPSRPLLGKELGLALGTGAHLSPEEAEEFERDLRELRAAEPPLDDPWA